MSNRKKAFTLSCKSFRSDLGSPFEPAAQSDSQSSQTKFRFAHSYGFTLTEVIVVIVIIAALALILIPNMLSLMPDDHNIKYKKAFYTIQEVVNDIANECQGLYSSGGQWYSIEEWNDSHPDNKLNPENVLAFCYDSDGTPLNLATEICKRLSTTGDCSSIAAGDMTGILTTNGMRWDLNGGMNLGKGNFYLGDGSKVDNKAIHVDIDGCGNNNTFNDNCITEPNNPSKGIYRIVIYQTGKVAPDDTSKNLLLDNPTKD